jgi:excisionase family DNA binding protein
MNKQVSGPNEMGRIFTTSELSEYLKVSIRTLQKWRDIGVLNFSAVGKKFYYTSDDVKSMLHNFKTKNHE